MTDFEFKDYEAVSDGEIEVVVRKKDPADRRRGYVPAYDFGILLPGKRDQIGSVSLRVGNTRHLIMYAGHIGYGIREEYRGNRYAAKACNLIKPVAFDHGLKTLWITCNPDNAAFDLFVQSSARATSKAAVLQRRSCGRWSSRFLGTEDSSSMTSWSRDVNSTWYRPARDRS